MSPLSQFSQIIKSNKFPHRTTHPLQGSNECLQLTVCFIMHKKNEKKQPQSKGIGPFRNQTKRLFRETLKPHKITNVLGMDFFLWHFSPSSCWTKQISGCKAGQRIYTVYFPSTIKMSVEFPLAPPIHFLNPSIFPSAKITPASTL